MAMHMLIFWDKVAVKVEPLVCMCNSRVRHVSQSRAPWTYSVKKVVYCI